jgi:hypothetical protein
MGVKRTLVVAFAALMCVIIPDGETAASSEGKADKDFVVDIYNPAKAWNGNTILPDKITPDKEIVWRPTLRNIQFRRPREAPALGFYKAERITR